MYAPALPPLSPKYAPQEAVPTGLLSQVQVPYNNVQDIPTNYMRRQGRLKRFFGR